MLIRHVLLLTSFCFSLFLSASNITENIPDNNEKNGLITSNPASTENSIPSGGLAGSIDSFLNPERMREGAQKAKHFAKKQFLVAKCLSKTKRGRRIASATFITATFILGGFLGYFFGAKPKTSSPGGIGPGSSSIISPTGLTEETTDIRKLLKQRDACESAVYKSLFEKSSNVKLEYIDNCGSLRDGNGKCAALQYRNYCLLHSLGCFLAFNNIILQPDVIAGLIKSLNFGEVCQHNSTVLISLIRANEELFLTHESLAAARDKVQLLKIACELSTEITTTIDGLINKPPTDQNRQQLSELSNKIKLFFNKLDIDRKASFVDVLLSIDQRPSYELWRSLGALQLGNHVLPPRISAIREALIKPDLCCKLSNQIINSVVTDSANLMKWLSDLDNPNNLKPTGREVNGSLMLETDDLQKIASKIPDFETKLRNHGLLILTKDIFRDLFAKAAEATLNGSCSPEAIVQAISRELSQQQYSLFLTEEGSEIASSKDRLEAFFSKIMNPDKNKHCRAIVIINIPEVHFFCYEVDLTNLSKPKLFRRDSMSPNKLIEVAEKDPDFIAVKNFATNFAKTLTC